MNRRTISREAFRALRSGDLVVWRGKYLRTVLTGPADKAEQWTHDGRMTLEFPIRQRSWTGRPYTTYCYSDLCRRIKVADKRIRTLLLPSEVEALKAGGFELRPALLAELEYREREAERLGRPLCGAFERIKRLGRKAAL